MISRTGRTAHLVTKLSVVTTIALLLAMIGTILPRVSAGLPPESEVGQDVAKDKPRRERRAVQAHAGQDRSAPERFQSISGVYPDRADVLKVDLFDRHGGKSGADLGERIHARSEHLPAREWTFAASRRRSSRLHQVLGRVPAAGFKSSTGMVSSCGTTSPSATRVCRTTTSASCRTETC